MTVIEELKELTKNYNIQDLYLELNKSCPKCSHRATLGKTYRILCPKCFKSYDVIDILKELNNADNLELLQLLRADKVNLAPVKNREDLEELREQHYKNQLEKQKKQEKINNMIFYNNIELTENAKKYLKDRGIYEAIKLLDKDIIEVKSNIYNDVETIVYRFKKQKTGIQKALYKNEKGKRFIKNLGKVEPISISHRSNKSNVFLIVEGIEDCLSALVLNENVICLNSTSNYKKFEELVLNNLSNFKKFKYELCLDNDSSGLDCLEKIETLFKKEKINYDISKHFLDMQDLNLNDLNDLLQYKCSLKTK